VHVVEADCYGNVLFIESLYTFVLWAAHQSDNDMLFSRLHHHHLVSGLPRINTNGDPVYDRCRLRSNNVSGIIKESAIAHGFSPSNFSTKSCRVTAVTSAHRVNQGLHSPQEVARACGHASVSSNQLYNRRSLDDVQHPLRFLEPEGGGNIFPHSSLVLQSSLQSRTSVDCTSSSSCGCEKCYFPRAQEGEVATQKPLATKRRITPQLMSTELAGTTSERDRQSRLEDVIERFEPAASVQHRGFMRQPELRKAIEEGLSTPDPSDSESEGSSRTVPPAFTSLRDMRPEQEERQQLRMSKAARLARDHVHISSSFSLSSAQGRGSTTIVPATGESTQLRGSDATAATSSTSRRLRADQSQQSTI
jgi:hypothetical protein